MKIKDKAKNNQACLVCNENYKYQIIQSDNLPGVTSDDKPWNQSGSFFVCDYCSHVQKVINDDWKDDIAMIYKDYDLYKLTDGNENIAMGYKNLSLRSEIILNKLEKEISLPKEGRLLDFGCGKGALLKTFGQKYKNWRLTGCDSDKRLKERILNLPGVEHFSSDGLGKIEKGFDIITANYVLEHLTQPVELLKQFRALLKESGIVSIVVPNFLENPFDLMVFDHCSHFTPKTLENICKFCGYDIVCINTEWLHRSIVILIKRNSVKSISKSNSKNAKRDVQIILNWLESIAEHIRVVSKTKVFGIFGTATASSWLSGIVEENIKFYVDEDTRRIGKEHLGKPVLGPSEIPEKAVVYVGLPIKLAKEIGKRLKLMSPEIETIIPPPSDILSFM